MLKIIFFSKIVITLRSSFKRVLKTKNVTKLNPLIKRDRSIDFENLLHQISAQEATIKWRNIGILFLSR